MILRLSISEAKELRKILQIVINGADEQLHVDDDMIETARDILREMADQ